MKRVWLTSLLVALLLSVITTGNVWAQATAQISGAVQDPTGAVLPGVEITATQTETSTLKAEVTLDPIPTSRTSVHQKAARIQVTFARSRPEKLERIMKRIVYVTLDRQEPVSDTSEPPAVRPEEPSSSDLIVDEPQPGGAPVATGALIEEDLACIHLSPRAGSLLAAGQSSGQPQLGTAGARCPARAQQRNRPRAVQVVSERPSAIDRN